MTGKKTHPVLYVPTSLFFVPEKLPVVHLVLVNEFSPVTIRLSTGQVVRFLFVSYFVNCYNFLVDYPVKGYQHTFEMFPDTMLSLDCFDQIPLQYDDRQLMNWVVSVMTPDRIQQHDF